MKEWIGLCKLYSRTIHKHSVHICNYTHFSPQGEDQFSPWSSLWIFSLAQFQMTVRTIREFMISIKANPTSPTHCGGARERFVQQRIHTRFSLNATIMVSNTDIGTEPKLLGGLLDNYNPPPPHYRFAP